MRQLRYLPSGCIPNQIDLVSSSSSHLAYSTSKLTYLFNPDNLAFAQVVSTAEKPITCICFNPLNSQQFVSISSDCKITQWNSGSVQPWVDGHYAMSECTLALPEIPIFCEYSGSENGLVAVLQRNGKIVMCNMNGTTNMAEQLSPASGGSSGSTRKTSRDPVGHSRSSSQLTLSSVGVVEPKASWGETLQKWIGVTFVTCVDSATCLRWLQGDVLLVGHADGSVSVLQKGVVLRTMSPPTELVGCAVRDLVLAPNNSVLALYSKSSIVSFNVDAGVVQTVFRPQPGFINSICPLPNFNGFLTCVNNNATVQVWNYDSDHPVDTVHLTFLCDDVGVSNIFPKQGGSYSLTYDINNTSVQEQAQVYMVLTDGSIRLIEMPSLRELARTQVFHAGTVMGCDEQNGMLAVCSAYGDVRVWNYNTLQCESLVCPPVITNQLQHVVMNTKGDQYSMFTAEEALEPSAGIRSKYGVRTGCIDTFKFDSFAQSLSEEALLVTGVHKALPLTDEMEEKAVEYKHIPVQRNGNAVSVSFHPTEPVLALACQENLTLRKTSGELLARLQVVCTQAQFLPANPQLILSSHQTDSFLTITETSGVTQQRLPHPMPIVHFDTSSHLPSVVAVGCHDNKVYLWNLSSKITKAPSLVLTGHTAPITVTHWAKGVRGLLATASQDNTVRVWDVLSGNCVSICSVPATASALLLHAELPHVLLVGDVNGCISAYDIRDSSLLFSSQYHLDVVTRLVSTSPFVVLSVGSDGGVREWSLTNTLIRSTYLCAALQGKLDASFLSDAVTVLRSQPTPDFLLCGVAKQLVKDVGTPSPTDLPAVAGLHAFFNTPGYARDIFQLASKIEHPSETAVQFTSNNQYIGSTTSNIVNNPVHSHINDVRAQLWTTARTILHDIDPVSISISANATSSSASPHDLTTALSSPARTGGGKKSKVPVVEAAPVKKLTDFPSAPPKLVTNPVDRERLIQAAQCFLMLGSMYEYCQVQIRLGEWERALALAPSVTPAYWKLVLLQYQNHLRTKNAPAALPFTLATGDVEASSALLVRSNQLQNNSSNLHSTGSYMSNKNDKFVSHTHAVDAAYDPMPLAIADYLGALPMPIRDETSLKADQQELTEFLAAEAEKEANDMKCNDIGANERMMAVIHSKSQTDCADGIARAKEFLRVNEPEQAVQFLLEADEVELAVSLTIALDLVGCDHVWRAAAAKCEALGLYDEALECLLKLEDTHANDVLLLCARFQGSNSRKFDLFVKAGLKTPTDYAKEGAVLLQNLKEVAMPLQKQGKGRAHSKAQSNVVENGESLHAKVQCLLHLVAGGKAIDAATTALQWLQEAYSKPAWSLLEIEALCQPLESLHLASLPPRTKYLILAHTFLAAGLRAIALQYTSVAPFLFNAVSRSVSASAQHSEASHEDNSGLFPVSAAQRQWILAQGVAHCDPVTAYVCCVDSLADQALPASSKLRPACAALKKQLEALPAVVALTTRTAATDEDKARARSPPTNSSGSSTSAIPQWQPTWAEVAIVAESGILQVHFSDCNKRVKQFSPVGAQLPGSAGIPYFAAHYAPVVGTVTVDKASATATKLFGTTLSPQAFAESKVVSTYGEVFSSTNYGRQTCISYGRPKDHHKLASVATGKQVGANPVVLDDGVSLISRVEALMIRELTLLSPVLSGQRINLA